MTKDPEDRHLDHMHFQKMGVSALSLSLPGISKGAARDFEKNLRAPPIPILSRSCSQVPEFDDYLIGDLEPKLNELIDIVNDING